MKNIYFLVSSLLILAFSCTNRQQESSAVLDGAPSIIPKPVKVERMKSSFTINPGTKIFASGNNPEVLRIAQMLAQQIETASGVIVPVAQSDDTGNSIRAIFFNLDPDLGLGPEGYQLYVKDTGIEIIAVEPAGLYYGFQTLVQLLPAEIKSRSPIENIYWVVPGVEIEDYPRFKWRGLHLDVARHFMPVDFVKEYIDNMAMHKLNTFHWHLTEDQGWRIEIKKYPKLTEVGAWRKETLIGHYNDKPHQFDGQRHGGFYTQEEIKEIVQYAKERFITVVPEIELPGHATAAIAAYPQLGVPGEQVDVVTYWGVFPDIFNVEDATFKFLEDVFSEVIELFPGDYIHVGGDEAIKDQWEASEKIQQQIKELGLKDEHELQSYFITRIEKYLNSKGKKLIGWDEILEGGLAPNAAVMSWQGTKGGITAAKSGHYVVMSPGTHLYFDHYQTDPENEPLAIGGYTTLEKVYQFEPLPQELSPEEHEYVLGAQANVWTEYMPTPEHVEYMVFPRISALAEVVWSPKDDRDWNNFKERIPKQLKRYEYRGINYAKVPLNIPLEKQNKK
ncbi:MAG: beta-N-acetylhexosaminidase [Bacteroidota bacterium]|nr:beta-N-acetylhexosaminidase [Bacteroidota bacterium]